MEAGGQPDLERLASQEKQVGVAVHPVERLLVPGHGLDEARAAAGAGEPLLHVGRAPGRRADHADGAAGRERPDLVQQLRVGRRRHEGDDRCPSGDEGDRLVGMERRGGHEVEVVPLQALDNVVDHRPAGLGDGVEGCADRLGGAARVGRRALHEEDVDARPGPPPLRGDGVDGGRHLVRGVPRTGGGAEQLRDEPVQRPGRAAHRRAGRDPRAGAVAADDVARFGETSIDRPHRVRVDPQHGAQLAHCRQPRARVKPTGVDLVRELPVELRGDRDVGVARDAQAPGVGRSGSPGPLGRARLRLRGGHLGLPRPLRAGPPFS